MARDEHDVRQVPCQVLSLRGVFCHCLSGPDLHFLLRLRRRLHRPPSLHHIAADLHLRLLGPGPRLHPRFAARNKMIADMEEEVLKRRSDQDARLNPQQQEAQDKEDPAFADKAEKRRREQIATNRSRQQQQQQRGIKHSASRCRRTKFRLA